MPPQVAHDGVPLTQRVTVTATEIRAGTVTRVACSATIRADSIVLAGRGGAAPRGGAIGAFIVGRTITRVRTEISIRAGSAILAGV